MELTIAGVIKESIVDGPGIRYTVFTQGCPHHCPGCHNPETWAFASGQKTPPHALLAPFHKDPILKGVTFSGGEPFCQAEALAELARLVHGAGKDVACYTGWTYEQLLEKDDPAVNALLAQVDLLIDGPFVLEQRNLELRFRGSENQRLIDMRKTREQGHVVLVEE